jgi:tetratricopeptide (TPR) repeat protein
MLPTRAAEFLRVIHKVGLLLLVAVLTLAPPPAAADAAANPPSPWAESLEPVPEADISGTERIARDAITRARRRLAELLKEPASGAADLAEAYAELGALYQLFEIDAPAALCWENTRRLQPDNYRWSYYAAYHALTRGDTESALPLFQKARVLKPDYPPLDLRLGQLWLETNQLDRARTALQKAAGQPGLRAAALYYLGQLDLLERDYQSAVAHLKEALSIDPEANGVHYPLAQAYRHLGKQELARQHLARFETGPPAADDPLVAELQEVLETSRAEFRLGIKAIEAQDYDSAVEHFHAGLEIAPENLAARVSYARALYLAGQTDAATRELEQVLERDPQQTLANFLMAVLEEARGKPEEAVERYRLILKRDPQHQGARFNVANLMFRQGSYREAAKEYAAALAASSDIPPARLLELVARHRAGKPDSNIAEELEGRVRLYPDQPELKYALIRLRALSGDSSVRDSVRALTLANALAPGQPTPPNIAALALAAAADGQFEQAARLQQQVIDMLGWMAPPAQVESMQAALEAYQQRQMPQQPVWPEDDPLLSPLPLNPLDPFRHYPAPVPY